MPLLRSKEIRAMDAAARDKKLRELRDELIHERGVAAMGGAPPNPGKIRALRKQIARIHTIATEEERLGRTVPAPAAEAGTPRTAAPKAEPEPEPDEDLDEDIEEDKA